MLSDFFPSLGNAIGNISENPIIQYESTLCFFDNGCNYNTLDGTYLKMDGGKNGKDNETNGSLPQLVPSANVNDKNQPPSSAGSVSTRRNSEVIMLGVKRKPYDGDEPNEFCKYKVYIIIL